MKEAGEELAEQLTGDLSEDEMKRIIDAHTARLKEMEDRFDDQKSRQQAELMEKLAQRRLKREMALRDEHSKIVSFCKCLFSMIMVSQSKDLEN